MDYTEQSNLKYMQIYNHYKPLIVNGTLKPDDRIPTESEIGRFFGVSRITVTKALNLLVNEGLVYRIQGGGTFVRKRESTANGNAPEFISFIASFNPVGREMDMIRGIENTIKDSGYLLSLSNTHQNTQTERELITSMKNKASAIVLYPSRSNQNIDLFYKLMKEEYPVVFVDLYPFNIPCSYVASDNYDGGYQVGKKFAEMGARQIALIFHDITLFSSELERYLGFIDALGESNFPRSHVKTASIQDAMISEDIRRILKQLLEGSEDERVTHIFACNAIIANTVIAYIRENEMSLPPELVVASFDDISFEKSGIHSISVRQNFYQIGEKAAQILLEKMKNPSYYERRVSIPIEIIERL